MSDFEWSETQCQPCKNFTPEDVYYGPERHCCPQCNLDTAQRIFCTHCNRDHHSGGWNTCDIESVRRCAYDHPACVKRAKETQP